jgi:hypothetical protein
MRVLCTAMAIALIAGPACAQTEKNAIPYGETAKAKSPTEIQADKEADKAYKRSLGNIPDQGPTDPWGNVRSDGGPKPVAKAAPAKHSKTGSTPN